MLELNLTRVSGDPYHIWLISKGVPGSSSELRVFAVNDEEEFVQNYASVGMGLKVQLAILVRLIQLLWLNKIKNHCSALFLFLYWLFPVQ